MCGASDRRRGKIDTEKAAIRYAGRRRHGVTYVRAMLWASECARHRPPLGTLVVGHDSKRAAREQACKGVIDDEIVRPALRGKGHHHRIGVDAVA
jgi:hypothetical protein